MPQVRAEMEKAICFLEKEVPAHTLQVAKSLFANALVKKFKHDALNFKIIEKKEDDTKWQISEVDFFAYSIKENAETLRKIIDSKEYKTGNFLLYPLKRALLWFYKVFTKALSFFKKTITK